MKNFLLLLGTQKCGTTWLSNQLKLHLEFESCNIKDKNLSAKQLNFLKIVEVNVRDFFFLDQEFWFFSKY